MTRFLRSSPLGALAAIIMIAAIATAVFAAQVAPYDPLHNDYTAARQPPSAQHVLGTDSLGRDVLSRIMYGLRISLIVSVTSIALGVSLGVVWGVSSGYISGSYDLLSQRVIEVLTSFPTLILAMLLSVALGPGLGTLGFLAKLLQRRPDVVAEIDHGPPQSLPLVGLLRTRCRRCPRTRSRARSTIHG